MLVISRKIVKPDEVEPRLLVLKPKSATCSIRERNERRPFLYRMCSYVSVVLLFERSHASFSCDEEFPQSWNESPRTSNQVSLVQLCNASVAAMNTMQSYYNISSGMYGTYPLDFWTTANAIEGLVNYINVTGDRRFVANIANTFNSVATKYFNSSYFDDQLW